MNVQALNADAQVLRAPQRFVEYCQIYTFFFQRSAFFADIALFHYLTFRTIAAFLTSFLVVLTTGPWVIKRLKSIQKNGQPIRLDGPPQHLETKKGTPTMGGVLILGGFLGGVMLWASLTSSYVWWILAVTLGFGGIGWWDDRAKLSQQSSRGLSATHKILLQFAGGLGAGIWIMGLFPESFSHVLAVPFFKNVLIPLHVFFPLAVAFVIVGTSNAVNLTDGLDGLAIGPVMIATGVFCVIAYVVGHKLFAAYLYLPHIPHLGELSVLCGSLIGGCLGFLWYNAPPASVFMGDTGSLAIGAFLGALGVATKHELLLPLVGGVFVLEALSVILQVGYYKRTKKRIFLMAPLHHHFEKKGWAEATIVFRFWTIAIVLGILSLATLKLR